MQDVKIGDRVRAKRIDKVKVYETEMGTLINFDPNDVNGSKYLVEFDKKFERGHDGLCSKIKGKPNHCGWVESVEKIENSITTNDKKYILI